MQHYHIVDSEDGDEDAVPTIRQARCVLRRRVADWRDDKARIAYSRAGDYYTITPRNSAEDRLLAIWRCDETDCGYTEGR
jgi:hypothetical protein